MKSPVGFPEKRTTTATNDKTRIINEYCCFLALKKTTLEKCLKNTVDSSLTIL